MSLWSWISGLDAPYLGLGYSRFSGLEEAGAKPEREAQPERQVKSNLHRKLTSLKCIPHSSMI